MYSLFCVLKQILQFLTSSRFIRLCKSCEDDLFEQSGASALRSVLDTSMGNLLTSLGAVMAHISDTLESNSDGVPTDVTSNVLLTRESFCEQLQDILALVFRHKSIGAVDADYYLLSDEWVVFLKPYEGFIRSLLRRHLSYDTDASYFMDDGKASPIEADSMMKTRYSHSFLQLQSERLSCFSTYFSYNRDGTLRSGPVFLELY